MSEQQQAHPNTTESELIAVRRDKLAKIRELGIDPYGARFDVTTTPAGLKADFQEDKQVAVAGRLLAIRDMGKSQFFVIGDVRGKIQGFLHRNEVDETTWKLWKLLDRGDWIGMEGTTAALLGGVAYAVLYYFGIDSSTCFVTGFVVTLSVRLAAIRWNWNLPSYIPLFSPEAEPEAMEEEEKEILSGKPGGR